MFINITDNNGTLLTRGYVEGFSALEIEDFLRNKFGMTPDKEEWESEKEGIR